MSYLSLQETNRQEAWGGRCRATSWESDIRSGEGVTGVGWERAWQAEVACHRAAEGRSKF